MHRATKSSEEYLGIMPTVAKNTAGLQRTSVEKLPHQNPRITSLPCVCKRHVGLARFLTSNLRFGGRSYIAATERLLLPNQCVTNTLKIQPYIYTEYGVNPELTTTAASNQLDGDPAPLLRGYASGIPSSSPSLPSDQLVFWNPPTRDAFLSAAARAHQHDRVGFISPAERPGHRAALLLPLAAHRLLPRRSLPDRPRRRRRAHGVRDRDGRIPALQCQARK